MNVFSHLLNRSIAHVKRFNSRPQHFPESVAEHSFFVAYITTILCNLLKEAGEDIQKEKAVEMALVHDMEESFSGDILTPFKHYSKEVTFAIRKVNKEIIQDVFADLPKELASHYVALWNEEGEGETKEAQLVKVADKLSLVAKCAEEVKVGNEFFQEIYNSQLEWLQSYEKPWWEKIKNKILDTTY